MKKIVKIFVLLLIINFNINVYADNDNNLIDDNKKETENETKEEVSSIKSNDATLKDIYINEEKIVCNNYVCEAIIKDNSVTEVSITYKTNHEKAIVSKEKIKEKLVDGENKFTVTVTAEDETKKEYIFKINKEVLSTDSSLKKLVVNGEEITLSSDKIKYQVSVSYSTKKIEIEAIPTDEKATIKDFKNNKASFDFFDTSKDFEIKVTSEAGDITTYTITVEKREEKDATLKSLKIEGANFDFESGVFDYETKVLKSIEQLEIEAIPTDEDAKVEINKPKSLEIGENTVTIKVSNDGNEKNYIIKVTRLNEEDKSLANLKSLEVEGYKIDFKEDKYEYDLKIKDENYLVIDPVAKIDDAQIEVTGNLDLVNGSIIKIKVNYDENNYNVYKINIIKDEIKEKDNNIVKIVVITIISLIIVVVIVLLIINFKKRKKKNNNKTKDNDQIDKSSKSDIITNLDEEIEEII